MRLRVALFSVMAVAFFSPAAPAWADCALVGSTVTCSPPGNNGYVDFGGDNLTLTVQPGATAVDSGVTAIGLNDNNVIINNGTIAAGDNAAGIYVNNGNAISNNGAITAGADGAGIVVNNGNNITNAGSITVGDGFGGYGIAVQSDNVVVNSGAITVGQGATGIAADFNSSLPAFNTVTNSGSIKFGDFGIGIIVTDNHRVLNSGSIIGSQGVGIEFDGAGNVLNNVGTIKVTGGGLSIESCGCSAVNNAFNNMSGGTLDGRLSIDGSGNTLTNSGLIIITDPATPLGYPGFLVANQSGFGAGNAFVQTANGTLALRMDNTGLIDILSADSIAAQGTLKVIIQPQLYQNTTFSGTAVTLTVYGAGTLGNTITSPFDHYLASSPFFTVTPVYDSGNSSSYTSLSVQLDRIPFGSVPGATPNQRAVGNTLEPGYSSGLDPTSIAGQFYANLLAVNSLSVLDQLSGAGTAAAQDAAFSAGGLFNATILQQGLAWLHGTAGGNSVTFGGPLGYAAASQSKLANKPGYNAFAAMPRPGAALDRWRAWGLGFGATRATDGQAAAGTADQSTNVFGGAFGADHQTAADLLFGFAVGGSRSHFSVDSLTTSGNADAAHLGVYAVHTYGSAYLAATLNYARADTSTERTIAGIGPTENAKGRFASDQLGGRVEFGWKHVMPGYSATPFAAVEPAALWQHAYTETSTVAGGAPGVLGLSYQSNTVTSLPVFLGAQFDTRAKLGGGQTLSPYIRLAWVHEFKPQRSIQASFINIPGTGFTADGARATSDAARIDAGATLALSGATALFANFNSELSSRSRSLAGMAGARISW